MEVRLKELQPNPYRDFTIDPIDEGNVKALTKSIQQDGFWGGVVCRRNNGNVEIGAGHHRVEAAIRAGMKTADVFIGDFDDAAMVRVYAVENATQRGNTSTALAGSVASAIEYLVKKIFSDDDEHVLKIFKTSRKGLEIIRGQITSDKGLGQPIILAFLHDVPGMTEGTINSQLANLKASGHYARIIKKVHDDFKEEAAVEPEVMETVEKAVEAAEAKPKTFDFEGVAKYFKNENQVRVFRKVVTGQGIAPYLPVNKQAGLAKRLVELAKERGQELSGAFIKENVVAMVLNVRNAARELSKEEQRRLEEQDWMVKAKRFQDDFSRNCRGMFAAGVELLELEKKWPKQLEFPITGEFRSNLRDAKKVIDKLLAKI